MSVVTARPLLNQDVPARTRFRIVACDVHPSLHAKSDLNPFLPKRWQEHLKTYGDHLRTPYMGTTPYPRSSPLIARRDAWRPAPALCAPPPLAAALAGSRAPGGVAAAGGPARFRSRFHAQTVSGPT